MCSALQSSVLTSHRCSPPWEMCVVSKSVRCTCNVQMSCKNCHLDSALLLLSQGDMGSEEVHMKYRVGPAGSKHDFYIVVYDDVTCANVFEIWHVTIHAVNRMDLQGLVGQTEREGCSLTLRSAVRRARTLHDNDLYVLGHIISRLRSLISTAQLRREPRARGHRVCNKFSKERPLFSTRRCHLQICLYRRQRLCGKCCKFTEVSHPLVFA